MMSTDNTIKNDQKSILAIGHNWNSGEALEPRSVTNPIHAHTLDRTNVLKPDVEGEAPGAIVIEIDDAYALSDTLELIGTLREKYAELVVITNINYNSPHAKIECYRAGADHCIYAPNDPDKKAELISVLFDSPEWRPSIRLTLDQTCLHLSDDKLKLDLAYQEMKVLDALINAQGNILHHDSIAEAMGLNIRLYDSRVLEKSISRLRNKIKRNFGINIIHSVRGYGYRLLRGIMSAK